MALFEAIPAAASPPIIDGFEGICSEPISGFSRCKSCRTAASIKRPADKTRIEARSKSTGMTLMPRRSISECLPLVVVAKSNRTAFNSFRGLDQWKKVGIKKPVFRTDEEYFRRLHAHKPLHFCKYANGEYTDKAYPVNKYIGGLVKCSHIFHPFPLI